MISLEQPCYHCDHTSRARYLPQEHLRKDHTLKSSVVFPQLDGACDSSLDDLNSMISTDATNSHTPENPLEHSWFSQVGDPHDSYQDSVHPIPVHTGHRPEKKGMFKKSL